MSISPSRAAAAFGAAVLAIIVAAPPSLAHGSHEEGDHKFVIGFADEPAYTGSPNAVQVIVTHDGEPVTEGVQLQVTVSFGDASTDLRLLPAFGEPGDYRADLVPSEPGAYTFHVTGTVEGEEVDIELTSGPDTFSEVTSLTEAAFPPVNAPSNEDLADRLEQESERLAAAAEDVVAAAEAASSASDDASSARTMAMVALVVGVVGLATGIAAARRKRVA
jgi:hypothetical protein